LFLAALGGCWPIKALDREVVGSTPGHNRRFFIQLVVGKKKGNEKEASNGQK